MSTIVRNSFIQMTKLSDVRGRINYICSPDKQENLYATYNTTFQNYWKLLAEYNQQEFQKNGTSGSCIEARELIIALPEEFTEYQPKEKLVMFVEYFKEKYGIECVGALHHNKKKTNYHIHHIFSERKLLEQPEEKIATRNRYYDEAGNFVRTKKEVTGTDGELREGCRVVKKGEAYERRIFATKDTRFKSKSFLEEVKVGFTDLINSQLKEGKNKLTVYRKDSLYLPTKKIGKNNPRKEALEAENELRKKWNERVEVAVDINVPVSAIKKFKEDELLYRVRESTKHYGHQPHRFATILQIVIELLEVFIYSVLVPVYGRKGVDVKWNHFAKSFGERITTKSGESLVHGIPDIPREDDIFSAGFRVGYTHKRIKDRTRTLEKRNSTQRTRNRYDDRDAR